MPFSGRFNLVLNCLRYPSQTYSFPQTRPADTLLSCRKLAYDVNMLNWRFPKKTWPTRSHYDSLVRVYALHAHCAHCFCVPNSLHSFQLSRCLSVHDHCPPLLTYYVERRGSLVLGTKLLIVVCSSPPNIGAQSPKWILFTISGLSWGVLEWPTFCKHVQS